MSRNKGFIFVVITLLFIVSCNRQTGQDAKVELSSHSLETSAINGVVSKGPIAAATIEIYAFDTNDGSAVGTPLATTTTDDNGLWTVSIAAAQHTQALLIKSSGGSYLDESDPEPDPAKKRRIDLAPTDSIFGALFPGFDSASVTMMTNALILKSRTESNGSNFINTLNNNRNIARSAIGFDPFTVTAANPLSPSASASIDSIEYAMYLGGMATALNSAAITLGVAVPDFAIIEGFINDMADGRLNGVNQAGAVNVLINNVSTAFPTNIDLNAAITRFRNNNFAAYSTTSVTEIVTIDEAVMAETGFNTSPRAVDDAVITVENAPVMTQNVITNDSDTDGHALTVSSFTQPANGQLVNNNDGTFTYTPDNGFSGTNIFTYTIDDGHGGTDTAQVVITVTAINVNAPPLADAGADQTVKEGDSVNLVGSGSSDSDGSIASYSWSQTDSTGIVATLSDASSALPTFTAPAVTTNTLLTFSLIVTDNDGAGSTADSVNVTVNNNLLPTANAGADQTVNEGDSVSLDGSSSSDSDGTVAGYSWSQTDSTGVIATLSDVNSALPTFTAPAVTVNTLLTFSLVVTDNDGANSVADRVSVMINNLVSNSQPLANAGADQSASTGDSVNLNGNGSTDSDGTIASYSWTQTDSSGVTATLTNANNVSASFTAPVVSTSTTLTFSLTVTDNDGASSADSINITVNPVNVSPTANAGADQSSANELTTINLDGSGSTDSDGTIAAYEWTQVGGTTVSLINSTSAAASFDSPEVLVGNIDVLVFQLKVTDDAGTSATDFVTVIVNPVLIAPTANAGADQTLNEGLVINLDGSLSSDDRLPLASFAWVQTAGTPTVTLTGANTATPSFTGPDIANNTTFTFELTVTDDEGGTATDTVNINLVSLNAPPTVVDDSATADEDVAAQFTNLLSNGDIDPEGDAFTINFVSSPTANGGTVIIDAGNTSVTYTSATDFNGTDTFTYTVIDSRGAISSAATVTVTVNPVNDNPVVGDVNTSVDQGIPVTITNLVDNASDVDIGDTLNIAGGLVTQATGGIAVNNNDGSFTYTPNVSFQGTDFFEYAVNDNGGGSGIGRVNITIINDTDGDGLTDAFETTLGTLPDNPDSDGDGFTDRHEWVRDPTGATALNVNSIPSTTIITTGNGDVISTDTTWSLLNSPYWLQNSVTINNGATLTIEAGVVIKTGNSTHNIIVSSTGVLNAMGNAPIPQRVTFTSALDDSINGDTNGDGVGSTPASRNWGGIDFNNGSAGTISNAEVKYADSCIYVYQSSPVFNNVDVGDCYQYGFDFQQNSGTHNVNLSNIKLIDYDNNGESTRYSGIRVYASGGTGVLNMDNITMTKPGGTTNYGLYVHAIGGSINGSVNDLAISNPATDGINILNQSSGAINVALSNLSVTGAGQNSFQIDNTSTGTVDATLDGTLNFLNNSTSSTVMYVKNSDPVFLPTSTTTIDGGGWGIRLINSNGSFENIALDNISIAGVRLEDASDPLVFSNIVLTNTALTDEPVPYELTGQNLTSTITTGYDYSALTAVKYIRVNGILGADMTFDTNPLGTGNIDWYITSDLTVPNGVTLTINAGAIVKVASAAGVDIFVDGTLNIDGTVASPVYITSANDDSVGLDIDGVVSIPGWNDWNGIDLNNTSSSSLNNLNLLYANRAIAVATPTGANNPSLLNVNISNIQDIGLYIAPSSGAASVTPSITNLTIDSTVNSAIYLYCNNSTLNPVFSGVTMTNIGNGSGSDYGLYIYSNNCNIGGSFTTFSLSNHNGGNALSLQNAGTTGDFTTTFTDTTLTGPDSNGIYANLGNSGGSFTPTFTNTVITSPQTGRGIYIDQNSTGTVAPVFTGVNSITGVNSATNLRVDGAGANPTFNGFTISGGNQLLFQIDGATGSYTNISYDGLGVAERGITLETTPVTVTSVVLSNTRTPFRLRNRITVPANVLAGVSYNPVDVPETYMEYYGTLSGGTFTMANDPHGTGSSVWHQTSEFSVAADATLNISSGAILKVLSGLSLDIDIDGTLNINGLTGAGNNVIITSVKDDTAGGDTNGDGATTPGVADWQGIDLNSTSTSTVNFADIRYGQSNLAIYDVTGANNPTIADTQSSFTNLYGLELSSTINVTSTPLISDFQVTSTNSHGVYIHTNAGGIINPTINNLAITSAGNGGSNDHGLYIYAPAGSIGGAFTDLNVNGVAAGRGVFLDTAGGNITTAFTNSTINPTSSSTAAGIYIFNNITATGSNSPTFNGLTITNVGTQGLAIDNANLSGGTVEPLITFVSPNVISNYSINSTSASGIRVDNANPTITGYVGFTLSGGEYGIRLLNGASGSYSDITTDGQSIASLYISQNSTPVLFSNISYTNAPSPYQLFAQTTIPAIITSNDTFGTGLVAKYQRISGTLPTGVHTLSANPLGASTVWYMYADLTVPVGATLNIDANTVIKSSNSFDLSVDGTLNVNGSSGSEVIMTDIRDDTVAGDSNSDDSDSAPGVSNWEGIDFRAGSQGTITSLIVQHVQEGILIQNAGTGGVLNFTDLNINNAVNGLRIYQTSSTVNTEPGFTNVSLSECSNVHLYYDVSSTTIGDRIKPSFSGTLTINDTVAANGNYGIYSSRAGSLSTPVSGWTITGANYGIYATSNSAAIFENNIVRQAAINGVFHNSTSGPVFRNNIIVNNGGSSSTGGGMSINGGGFIYSNLIRNNQASTGGGVYVNNSSPVIQNNLIVQNHSTANGTNGGSGIRVVATASPQILNNTIAHNTSANTTAGSRGAGLSIENTGGILTFTDNIIYANIDSSASPANDVYNESSNFTEDFNLIGVDNIALNGINDIPDDPLFTDGWYISSISPAIDAGSDLATNIPPGSFDALTTQTGGAFDTNNIDLGYHYILAAPTANINTGNSTALPATDTLANGQVGSFTIDPRDVGSARIGAGLDVVVTASLVQANVSKVIDNGDGTYTFTYTSSGLSGQTDTLNITVNGVSLTATIQVSMS